MGSDFFMCCYDDCEHKDGIYCELFDDVLAYENCIFKGDE